MRVWSVGFMTLLIVVVCNSMLVIPCVYSVHLAGVFGSRIYMLTCMVFRNKIQKSGAVKDSVFIDWEDEYYKNLEQKRKMYSQNLG